MSTQIDTRLGEVPRYYLWPQEEMNMRVPDQLLKSTVFIGMREGTEPVYRGTAFLVGVDGAYGSPSWIYLVTAKHVAERLDGSDFVVRVNRKEGSPIVLEGAGTKWWYHPTDVSSVDAAVTTWGPPPEVGPMLDVATVPMAMFATDPILKDQNIGIGDQVFIIGLFTRIQQTTRNIPIVRIGNVAMMPGEPILFRDGLIDAYLIESRSIGGLSGSPVFVRSTVILGNLRDGANKPTSASVTSNTFYFLGSVIGHWEETTPKDFIVQQEAVNMGIAPMVPAQRIAEIISHPELVEMRKKWDEDVMKKRGAGAVLDSEFPEKEKPFTKDDFETALKKASRKTTPKN